MRKTLFLLITILVTTLSFGQNFEGKIQYSNIYKSKNNNITDQQWSLMMGSNFEYSIKNGDYKSLANGTIFQWQLYNNKENKIYNKISNSEAAIWIDASIKTEGDEILKTQINKSVTTILGYLCDELVLTCKSGIQKYYFNSSVLKANPETFANHKFANWYEFLKITKSLCLKSIIETDQFILESTVTKITPLKLDDTLFKLPVGMEIVKQ